MRELHDSAASTQKRREQQQGNCGGEQRKQSPQRAWSSMAARTPAGGLMSRISYRMHCRPQSDAASLRICGSSLQ